MKILSLFFTNAISLELWVTKGLIHREKLIYEAHLQENNFDKIYWFTYGSNDKKYYQQLIEEGALDKRIEVIPAPWWVDKWVFCWLYSILLPIIHQKKLKASLVIKSNQIEGAWAVIFSKWLYGTKAYIRSGYTPSRLSKVMKRFFLKQKYYEYIERFAYKNGDTLAVASQQDKNYVTQKYDLNTTAVNLLPNYIDTQLFKPIATKKKEKTIIFIGRLSHEKNLYSLIEAISKTDFSLDLYGAGKEKDKLVIHAKKLNAKINFKGVVPNYELPAIINQYAYYILSSFFEGMPKTLLEAMSCGVLCIGTNVSGINEVIHHGIDGILTKGIDAMAIAQTLNSLDQFDYEQMTKNGRKKIVNQYSLKSLVKSERIIINRLVENTNS